MTITSAMAFGFLLGVSVGFLGSLVFIVGFTLWTRRRAMRQIKELAGRFGFPDAARDRQPEPGEPHSTG